MQVLTFHYNDLEIKMPIGVSLIGRSVECELRFNDAAVSRKHLRVFCSSNMVMVENLSSTNGTRLNGQILTERTRLTQGDILQIGHRKLRVHIDAVAGEEGDAVEEEDSGEMTRPGEAASVRQVTPAEELVESISSRINFDTRNCPQCRAANASTDPLCSQCGYRWPSGSHGHVTQEINISNLQNRAHPRHVVEVPVMYSSDDLTLDVVAHDLSKGGMFIASQILEPVGTRCKLTALPDGHPAIGFDAEVCHVSTKQQGNRPIGFGLRFVDVSPAAQEWLGKVLPS